MTDEANAVNPTAVCGVGAWMAFYSSTLRQQWIGSASRRDGHVDFIFGSATAFFERCHIHFDQFKGWILLAPLAVIQALGWCSRHAE